MTMINPQPAAADAPTGFATLPRDTGLLEQRQEERRDRIALSGLDAFAKHGYQKTRIEDVCTKAKVSTRDFYKLYGDKESLLLEVYERISRYVEQCVTEALARAKNLSLEERVEHTVDAWIEGYTRDLRYTQVGYIVCVGVSSSIETHRRRAHRRMAALIADELSQAPDTMTQDLNPQLALAIVGGANELVVDWLASDPRPASTALAQQIHALYRIILAGLRKIPEASLPDQD